MKTLALALWTAAAVVAFSGPLHSQLPVAPGTPREMLQKMKAQNAALLEKQAATLLQLDEVSKDAQQIKFLSKRS